LNRLEASICSDNTFKLLDKFTLCETLVSKELILALNELTKEFVDSVVTLTLSVATALEVDIVCAASLRLRIFKIAAKAGNK
jgi:hypothetical protein